MSLSSRVAIASRLVKEIASCGGEITKFVIPAVRTDIVEQSGHKGD